MRKSVPLPSHLWIYSGRQLEILKIVFARGGATAAEVYSALEDRPPSVNGIRTLLNRLTDRGVLSSRRKSGAVALYYFPAGGDDEVQCREFRKIAKLYFKGSTPRAVAALRKLAADTADADCGDGRAPNRSPMERPVSGRR